MHLYTLFGFIVASSLINGCKAHAPDDAFKKKVADEAIIFEKIIVSFLQEEAITDENFLVEVRPFRIDTTMTKQEWNKWLEGQNELITSREEILENKNLEKIDIEIYQSCNFPPQMVPPVESDSNFELPDQCKALQHKRAIEISLSQNLKSDKDDQKQRSIKATLFLNYGHIEYEFIFYKENEQWLIAEKKKLSSVLS